MKADRRLHPLIELSRTKFFVYLREPGIIIWSTVFPLLLTFFLGLAFPSTAPKSTVVVLGDHDVDAIAATIAAQPRFTVERLSSDEANQRLRAHTVALIVAKTADGLDYRYDSTRVEGLFARSAVDDALERAAGRQDTLVSHDDVALGAGGRYVDWLLPGMLGMQLLSGSCYLVLFMVAHQRGNKELKRLGATPMTRRDYILSFFVSRFATASIEVPLTLIFGWLVFGVTVRGSLLNVVAVAALGVIAFSSLGVLAASRIKTADGAAGAGAALTVPMGIICGVFFSTANFPPIARAVIRALPLTALNEALRATINDGAPLQALAPQLAILVAWAVGSFLLALRLFRWA